MILPRSYFSGRFLELYDHFLRSWLPKKFQGYLSWRRHWKYDEAILARLMGSKGAVQYPKLIPLIGVTELITSIHPELYHYNPSLKNTPTSIKIFWRISNYSDSPEMGRMGLKKDLKKRKARSTALVNGVGTAIVLVEDKVCMTQIIDEEIVIFPEIDSSHLVAGGTKENFNSITFEDPRCVDNVDDLIILTASDLVDTGSENQKRQQVAVFDLLTNKADIIASPFNRLIEKNWTPIKREESEILFLYSSSPEILIKSNSSDQYEIEILECNESRQLEVNGGSQFVLVDSSFYLRVARSRFSLRRLWEIHVSFIIMHDLNFREIARTKPFIFKKYSYEICNGFILRDNYFYFSWGENDEKMFFGKMKKNDLITWIEQNKGF
jgi:hypothetical protein